MNNLSYDLESLNNEISSCLLADDFVIQQIFETEDIPFLFVKIRDKFYDAEIVEKPFVKKHYSNE